MEELLKQQLHWKSELGLTDPSDPYSGRCRQMITDLEARIEVEKSKSKKATKKATKKSKK
jgi:hypothetical protein